MIYPWCFVKIPGVNARKYVKKIIAETINPVRCFLKIRVRSFKKSFAEIASQGIKNKNEIIIEYLENPIIKLTK